MGYQGLRRPDISVECCLKTFLGFVVKLGLHICLWSSACVFWAFILSLLSLLCIFCMCLLGIHPMIVEFKHEEELKCCKSKTFPNFYSGSKTKHSHPKQNGGTDMQISLTAKHCGYITLFQIASNNREFLSSKYHIF